MRITNAENERNKLFALLMTILGMTLASDIIYIFSVGSTHFTISEVYSVILFIFLLFVNKIKWNEIFRIVGLSFQLFCIMILFSGLFALITFTNIGLLYRFVVGVISFGICLTSLIDVITLFEYRKFFVKGCAIGIVINGIISIIQYISYQMNTPFTILYEMFKQESFHMNVYNFCAQGLFLEPSHMNQFLASVLPILIGIIGMKTLKNKIVLISAIICCVLSTSGTAAVVLVGIVLYSFGERKISRYVKKKSVIKAYAVIIGVIICVIFIHKSTMFTELLDNVSGYIQLAAEGSNIEDSSNVERVESMQAALKLIPENLLGCGWNMVHTLLQEKTNLNTVSAFSDMLEMLLEIGILGIGLYILTIVQSINTCLKLHKREATGVAVALICILIMEILADYAINPCIMSVLAFGMCFKKEYVEHD